MLRDYIDYYRIIKKLLSSSFFEIKFLLIFHTVLYFETFIVTIKLVSMQSEHVQSKNFNISGKYFLLKNQLFLSSIFNILNLFYKPIEKKIHIKFGCNLSLKRK